MDTCEMTVCSTLHEALGMKEAGVWQTNNVSIPYSVLEDNHSMGGMDRSDALIGYCSVHYKVVKTLFYHCMDISVVNSFLLHKDLFKKNNPAMKRQFTQKHFRENLAGQMLELSKASAPPSPTTTNTCMHVLWRQWYPIQYTGVLLHQKGKDTYVLHKVPGPYVLQS